MQTSTIETLWINAEARSVPLVVFLHEGLGSVALWRDFPKRFCDAMNVRGLVFSRQGYGQSMPRKPYENWPADFMHQQAIDFLPAFFELLGIDTEREPPILFSHSDGATIALIYEAIYPSRVRSVIALAPHVMVEDITVASIREVRTAFEATDSALKRKLSRYHADVDSAFYGWCDVWLSERPSKALISGRCCRTSPAPCWRCKASKTPTARWRKLTKSRCKHPIRSF